MQRNYLKLGYSIAGSTNYPGAFTPSILDTFATTGIDFTSNYGLLWTSLSTPTGNTRCVAVSSTGQYQTLVLYNTNLYISSDYGSTWTGISTLLKDTTAIAISSSGQYQSLLIYSASSATLIYYSRNYGNTWTATTTSSKTSLA